jgi:hypothetical protein
MSEELIALIIGLVGTVLGAVLIGGAMFGAYMFGRARGRREAAEHAPGALGAPDMTHQLARVERLVNDMELELERLGEAQRFRTKQLSEGSEPEKPEG